MRFLVALTAAAVAVLCVEPAAAAKPLPLEAQAAAEINQWQQFAYAQAAELAHIEQAVWGLQVQLDAFLVSVAEAEEAARQEAAAAAEAARQAAVQSRPAPAAVTNSSPGGPLTDAMLRALSQCESGGQNGWRTGYFGIEAGYPIGHLSWDEQAAWAQRIYQQSGRSAWGCANQAGLP